MKFRRKKRERIDINLISMIDILFVLLLFFMVSTSFSHNTQVKLKLPEAGGSEGELPQKMVNLIIDAEGKYYLQGEDGLTRALVNQKGEGLKATLDKLAVTSADLPFVINADGKSPHQSVLSVLEAASSAGFNHITFAAQKTGGEK
ncbi:biopolymer transporter ExbD [Methylosoma difficile]